MHISHNFIATKTCLSYEFLVVFGRCGFETEKMWDGQGGDGLQCALEVCGVGAGKISQTPVDAGRFKFSGCGADEDKKFKPTQDSMTYSFFLNFLCPHDYVNCHS